MNDKSYDWRADPYFSLVPPLYLGIVHGFQSADDGAAIFSGEKQGYAYGRMGNPNVELFQNWLSELEGGSKCWATNSGLQALLLLCLSLNKCNVREIAASPGIYGGSRYQLNLLKRDVGFTVNFIKNPHSLNSWRKTITSRTSFALLETPSNPTLDIFDIEKIAKITREKNVPFVVDNTLAPILQKPFAFGADIVFHSVTKYLNRQSTGLGGAIVISKKIADEYGAKIDEWFTHAGSIMHPLSAWFAINNSFTLERDMRVFSFNARKIAEFLDSHPKVRRTYYPNLLTGPYSDIVKKQMPDGCGGLLAFELENYDAAKIFANSFKRMYLAPHLGDSRYLAIHPASTTHGRLSKKELADAGIAEGLIRVSAGLEFVEPILEEIENILKKI